MSQCMILIGGDVVPMGRIQRAFAEGDAAAIFHDLLAEFQSADLSVVNLEAPLIDAPSPIAKSGSLLGVSPQCIRGLQNAGIRAVNLANNHILDHGAKGLRRTIRACREAGIECFGAGQNLAAAAQWLVNDIRGVRIAFAGLAEREFSIAGSDSWGANPLDVIDFCRMVRKRRNDFDHLVVLLHGGAERYPYPSPNLQKTCRFLVEQGATAVICQHSHCPGTCECYQGAPIVYGQGNLVFEWGAQALDFHRGFLVKLLCPEPGSPLQMEMVPYCQSYDCPGARKMSPAEEAELRRNIEERSAVLGDEQAVDRLWRDFAWNRKDDFLGCLRGYGRFRAGLNRRLKFASHLFSRQTVAVLLDFCRCDSNRGVLEVILEDLHRAKNRAAGDGTAER